MAELPLPTPHDPQAAEEIFAPTPASFRQILSTSAVFIARE